jgi:hypothetical protein
MRLFIRLLLHKAPHFIGFCFQAGQHHLGWLSRALGMEVIGAGCKAFRHKVQQPRETHADSTADPTEGDTLAEQVFNLHALLGRNTPVQDIRRELVATRFTLVILLPMTGMAVLLVPVCSTCWTRISDDHGGCWPFQLEWCF